MGTNDEAFRFRHVIIDAHGPQNPHIKAVGDVNGDGFADVVVASSNGGPLVWYEYPGWTRRVIAPSGRWSTDARLVDMDGDGDLDVLISEWYTHGHLEWYENPRPGGDPASDPWARRVIGGPRAHDIEVGDLDADGRLEIVTRTQGRDGDHIVIRKQGPDRGWVQRAIPCPAGEGLAVGDMDGDGRLDVVISDRWYRAPEDLLSGPWEAHVFSDWTPDAVAKLADMNGDGRLDVVLTRSEGLYRLSWFEAPSDPAAGTWVEHVVDDSVDFAHSLEVCDLNGDGGPDIVTAEMHQSPRRRVMIYLNEGLRWRRQVVAVTGSHKLCVADIGNTGALSLIGANWSGDYQPVEMWERVAPEKQG